MDNENHFGLVDLEYLREISGNDADFIKEMLDMFLVQTPELMTELSEAISGGNFADIKAAAHKVKPTFAMVGRDDFRQAMQQIENLAKEEGDLLQIKVYYDSVNGKLPLLFKDIITAKTAL